MREKYLNNYKYSYLILILSFYFFGFFQRENIAGGAEQDFFKFTWPLLILLRKTFLHFKELWFIWRRKLSIVSYFKRIFKSVHF